MQEKGQRRQDARAEAKTKNAPEDGSKQPFLLLLFFLLLHLLPLLLLRQLALLVRPLMAQPPILDLTSDLGLDLRGIEDGVVGEDLHEVLERH